MTTEAPSEQQEDEIKYLLLAESQVERLQAADMLFRCYGVVTMRSIEHHHPGLSVHDHQDILTAAIDRFVELFPQETDLIDRPLRPRLLRVAYFVGREHYRKASRRRERESGDSDLVQAVAQSLEGSDFGRTWHHVADASFRERVGAAIRAVAAGMKPRQRQIALFLAETWGMEYTEHEAIAEIYRTSGERLTRDQYKRALDEVRIKLREPIRRLLNEEGYA